MSASFNAVSGLCLFALAVTSLASGASGAPKRAQAGQWGALGVAMEVTDAGARLEFDCAHGTASEPLLLDSDGRFDVKGLYFREHGGPIRQGEEPRGEPVRYIGQVTGDTMALTIKPDGGDAIASYNLTHGKTGRLRKCL